MKKYETNLKDCYVLEPDKFGDERGYFSPYFIQKNLNDLGFKRVVQTNRSKSSKGVLRGLHFQKNPYCQAKIVEVIKGRAIDVVVDMRVDSPTYGQYFYVELTADNNKQLFVPRGFAHGFVALEDDTIFQYLIDNDYAPKMEAGIKWNDPSIGIDWDKILKTNGITEPLLSAKDQIHPGIKDNKIIFKREQEKYLIIGYNGQLGFDIKRELIANGIKEENILATDINNMDITDPMQVQEVIGNFKPDVIFHCAAYTAVDKAEEEKGTARKINVDGCKNITEAAMKVDAKVIYLSSDYVFDGKKTGLYLPTDATNPLSFYGETKYLGEEEIRKNPKHFVCRTSWVFGINGKNFIRTMLNLADNHKELSVVDDQIGSPTYTVDLAHTLYLLSQTDNYGTYHTTNEEFCSWAEFAEYIFRANNKDVAVNKVSTAEYSAGKNIAPRPENSRLDKSKLEEIGLHRMPTWQNAADRYFEELKGEAMVLRRFKK